MIRRGDQFKVGPLRIEVGSNTNGLCSIHVLYAAGKANLGTGIVKEEVLEQLQHDLKERPA